MRGVCVWGGGGGSEMADHVGTAGRVARLLLRARRLPCSADICYVTGAREQRLERCEAAVLGALDWCVHRVLREGGLMA